MRHSKSLTSRAKPAAGWQRVALAIVILAITVIAPSPVSAQSSTTHQIIVNYVEGAQVPGQFVYDVHAFVSVLDTNGNPIPGLVLKDFKIAEDSLPAELSSVGEVASPISLILVIDTSQSMVAQNKIGAVKDAAVEFVKRLGVEDKAALVTFNLGVNRDAELTADHDLVADRIRLLEATGAGTCLYDAAYSAVQIASAVQGRRAVILLTDGRDEVVQDGVSKPCSKYVLDDVTKFAADTAHVPMYTVAVGADADTQNLSRLAALTGGLYSQLAGAEEVEAYFELLAKQLSSQYELVYRSHAAAGPHNVSVEVNVNGTLLTGTRSFVLPELAAFPIITEPGDGDAVSGSVVVKADVEGRGDVNRLALLVDGQEVASDKTTPFEFQWDSSKYVGKKVKLEVVIYDSGDKDFAHSEVVSVSVAAPAPKPTTAAPPTYTPIPAADNATTTSKTDPLPIIIAVAGTLAVVIAAFFGVRWWQGRKQASYVVWSGAQGEPFATLVLEQSDTLAAGRRFDLRKPVTTLGRSSSNDIVLPDRPISRTHAELREKDGVLTIVEVKSEQDGKMLPPRYGTFVNDAPLPAAGKPLRNGDRIRLGSRTVLRLERAEAVREDATYDSLAVDDRTFDQLAPVAGHKDPDETREFPDDASSELVEPTAQEAPDETRELSDTGTPPSTIADRAAPDQTRELSSDTSPPTPRDDKTRLVDSDDDEPPPDATREIS